MTWLTTPKMKAIAVRDLRIARAVLWKLRHFGYAAQLFDIRDASGVRLHPANIQCGQRFIACRALGYKPAPTSSDAAFLLDSSSYLQCGALDIAQLCEWLGKP